jgi:prepilin-type N-terminal cleavage/methylation domain-containing protein/prepilin-type processing-associated H-X9-DG protein
MAVESKKNILSNHSNASFTLIELLVVIAIISLLIAITLPTLNKIRSISKRMACKSNLRQIALAWHMYLDDYDGAFFQGINAHFIYGGWEGILFQGQPRPLNKYFSLPPTPQSESEAKLFRCPADKGDTGSPFYITHGTSYSTNILLIGQNKIGWLPSTELKNAINARLKNLNRSRVDNPARLLLIGDYCWGFQWLPSPYPQGAYWHGRKCHYNVAFLDGHVDFLHIHKGLYITPEYTVLPFKDLCDLAQRVQKEEPDE